MNYVYFGQKFFEETDGLYGYLVNATTQARSNWEDMLAAIVAGHEVHIRHASAEEILAIEADVKIMKSTLRVNQQSALC